VRTWKKALRRLYRKYSDSNAARWPHVYRRLTQDEISKLVREAWADVGPRLTSVPRRLVCSNVLVQPGERSVWCKTLLVHVCM